MNRLDRNRSVRQCARKNPYYRPSQGIPGFLPDLERMVLERARPEDLKYIARVSSNWRRYISNNMARMRLLPVQIVCILPGKARVGFFPRRKRRRGEKKLPKRKCLISYEELIKYSPKIFAFGINSNISDEHLHLSDELERLPSWWPPQSVKIAAFHTNRLFFPASFLQRFKDLKQIRYFVRDSESIISLIMEAPKTEVSILDNSHRAGDSALAAIIERSKTHPTEYPILLGRTNFSVAQIIRFIQENCFTEIDVHKIDLTSRLDEMKGLFDWIEKNTTVTRHTPYNDDFYSMNPFEYEFTFRGMNFLLLPSKNRFTV